MPELTPRTFKGTRDILPEDMRIRENILTVMKSVFTRYGFAPLETPAMEYMDILAGKYGDEADKLLYPLAYKGGKELALRYDLTVPLARVVAMHPHLPKPFKRYQIQPVWRADSPQLRRGRFREFYQCDVDTVGSSELMADAEIIALMVDVFDKLSFSSIQVTINSRKVLRGMITGAGLNERHEQDVCRSIDKLEKEGLDTVRKELNDKKFPDTSVAFLCDLLGQRAAGSRGIDLLEAEVPGSDALREGLDDIRGIMSLLKEMMVPDGKVVFDFALARGLDYYTGPIFEVVFPEKPEVGSIAGGGRYDDLVGLFLRDSIPATGTSFGLERIHTLVKSKQAVQNLKHNDSDILICFFNSEMRADCLRLTRELRTAGLRCEMYFKPDKMKKQFGYADRKNIPLVLIFGPDEKDAGMIAIKNMTTGKQALYERGTLTSTVKSLLNSLSPDG